MAWEWGRVPSFSISMARGCGTLRVARGNNADPRLADQAVRAGPCSKSIGMRVKTHSQRSSGEIGANEGSAWQKCAHGRLFLKLSLTGGDRTTHPSTPWGTTQKMP